MSPRRPRLVAFPSLALLGMLGCSSSSESTAEAPITETPEAGACQSPLAIESTGSTDGHPDPTGARAAGQARAGRVRDASMIVQPEDARQKVRVGDYLLANDKIAVYIEDRGLSDGYARFGGEILAIDQVGDDGKPKGLSHYGETLVALSTEMVNPDRITVENDGSDGRAAVLRVAGRLESVPFFGSLKSFFPREYGLRAAYDYVLEPHSEKLLLRLTVVNDTGEAIDFGKSELHGSDEMHGFFQYARSQMFTPTSGYATPKGEVPWVGFDSGPWSFAWRTPGAPLSFGLEISGFQYYVGRGFQAPPCSVTTVDHAEVIGGGPWLDGLREAVRRVDGDATWRTITGTLKDPEGAPLPDAWVHELATDGTYLSRTKTDAQGAFTLHAPPQAVKLSARVRGYGVDEGTEVPAETGTIALALPAPGLIHVKATEGDDGQAIPVRIQIVPEATLPATPEDFGDEDEANGRLHQEFAMSGEATLPVPPGRHRVIVSRGYEWELLDTAVDVTSGATTEVAAPLAHSVDTTGALCADFHIHSHFSADSNDDVERKVKSAIADGLDLPVSSEHEWVIDFQPVIEKLGMQKWAHGFPSEELTTFVWGHFGVVPLTPRPDSVNAGALEWIGKTPPEVFDAVRALPEAPAFIVNHPSGGDFGSYFSAAGYKREAGVGKKDLWSDNFDAVEVFNDSDLEKNRRASVADWFSLLEHGKTVWAVGSSDSHHLRTSPVGYPRTCLLFGHDDVEAVGANDLRDMIKAGRSTVSGGLYMTVTGPGGELPGQTAKSAASTATFTVTVESPSWVDARNLEVIVNGVTVSTEALLPMGPGPSHRYVNQVTVPLDTSRARNWVVFHASGEGDLAPLHPGRKPFAVSNPVFFVSE